MNDCKYYVEFRMTCNQFPLHRCTEYIVWIQVTKSRGQGVYVFSVHFLKKFSQEMIGHKHSAFWYNKWRAPCFRLPLQNEGQINIFPLLSFPWFLNQVGFMLGLGRQTLLQSIYSFLLASQRENLGWKCALSSVFKQLIMCSRNKKHEHYK